jgi:hypothetical protein
LKEAAMHEGLIGYSRSAVHRILVDQGSTFFSPREGFSKDGEDEGLSSLLEPGF